MTFNLKIRPGLGADINAACKRALEICGGKAETYAKKKCPVSPGGGRLRGSITHQMEGDKTVVIGTPVEYAPYVEFGHHQQPGRYVPAIGKRLKASYVPGKPYLVPALEEHIDEYKNVILTELNSI